ncbi:coiled-coil domain-containing protein 58-like [Anneissia japonica]|uniref:coiled-coil domain-containing protein 58-like n=1 Tax=Anneissia japonica TaxID=1529436 RepID=UPI001425916C|nr:coiled-coil domain-containing protein 58-like [Anneissia japonica]
MRPEISNMAASMDNVTCGDFAHFQDALKVVRMIDDKIIYALNTSVPTTSFKGQINATEKCKQLYEELMSAYDTRDRAIKRCIREVSASVNTQRSAREKSPDDFQIIKDLRKEQTKLRLLQSELSIEEVVKDRSLKVFHERCRNHYIPPTQKDRL